MGEWGEGGPVIAILGEYDALPALSQQPGVATHSPVEEGGHGHGCGHNLLGSAAILAATAVRDWLEAEGIPGRVRYYGCPAEEGGAAKTYMVRDGLFADVDAAISWHPFSYTGVDPARSLANTRIDFTFHGKAAHAAGAPELGRSALDAVELMNIGVNYMREHMPDDARVHYAYLDAGGIAPNVVPARATVRQLIRARDLAGLADLVARVRAIADGAALMNGHAGGEPGPLGGVEPRRQPPPRGGDAAGARRPRPGAVRRRRPRLRRGDPRHALARGHRGGRSATWAASPTTRCPCATRCCRSTGRRSAAWARPTWET